MNNFAISSGGIGEALTRSASALAAANNTLDESIALIVGANTVVQNPESVGTAFKTLSMRIRGAKTELEEAGLDTDGMASSVSKLRDEIKSLSGVDIMADDDTFKSTIQILRELSGVWEDLTDVTRANITELIAGKRQANVINSIFSNWDTVEKSLATSLNSSGSAMQEHSKYLDSVKAKTDQLKASWQALSKDFIGSDLVKSGIDILTGFAKSIDVVVNALGGLGTAGAIVSIVSVVKMIKNLQAGFATLNWNSGLITLQANIAGFAALASAYMLVTNAIKKHREEQRQDWRESVEKGKTAAEELENVESLRNTYESAKTAYEHGVGSKTDYDNATKNLLDALGVEETQIDNLIAKHGSLTKVIEEETKAKQESTKDALADALTSAQELVNDDNGTLSNWTIFGSSLKDIVSSYNLDLSNNAKEAYRQLENYRQSLIDAYGEDVYDRDDYKAINAAINERKENIDALANAEEKYFDFLASTELTEFQDLYGDVNSAEQFEKLLSNLESVLDASSLFEKSGRDAREYALEYLSGIDKFAEQYTLFLERQAAHALGAWRKITGDKSGSPWDIAESVARGEITTSDYANQVLGWIDNELNDDDKRIVYQIAIDTPDSALWDLDQWKQQLSAVKGETDSATDSLNGFYDLMKDDSDEGFTKRIEAIQERISKLQEIRGNLANYSTNEAKYSLITEFPELAGSINNINDLDDAINRLIDDSYRDINTAFSDAIEGLGGKATESGNALNNLRDMFIDMRRTYDVKDFETYQEQYSSALSAVNKGFSAGGMAPSDVRNIVNMYGKLKGFDYRTLFENTAQGIQVNANAMRLLNREYTAQQKQNFQDYLQKLTRQYKAYQEQLEITTDAQERDNIQSRLAWLESEYNDVQLTAAAYEGLTSAYNEWQNAQKQTDSRNAWEQAGKGLEGVQELISQGWVNDAEVIAYANRYLEIGEKITSWQEMSDEMWANMVNTTKRYYTENASGLETFLNDIMAVQGEMGWVTQLADGTYDVNVEIGDMVDIASELTNGLDGIQLSSENVLEMFNALKEAGFIELPDDWDKPIQDAAKETELLIDDIEEVKEKSRQRAELNLDSQKAWVNAEQVRKELNDIINAAREDKKVKLNTSDAVTKLQELNEKLAKLQDKDIRVNVYTGTIYTKTGGYTGSVSAPGRNGPSRANGTAFAHGNWGTRSSGVALTGELGQELVVRDGAYFTVGDNGAEFFNYKPGDIVFNARQTEEILKYGGTKGRGIALAEGTAFASGATGSVKFSSITSSSKKKNSSSSASSNRNSSSNSSSSSEAEEFEETLDWIEVKIDRVERAINELDTLAQSVYKSWTSRNRNLSSEISEVVNEISIAQAGYNRYIQEANSVGLSESWAQKVRDGLIDIDTITDEDLADKIKSYEEWYNKAIELRDKIIELRETEASLYKQRFDNVITEYEGYLGVIEHERSMLEESISQTEARGYIVSERYYEALQETEEKNIKKLEAEKTALLAELQNGVSSGTIVKESEAWYEMISDIDGVTESIAQANTQLIEYSNNIRDIKWEVFDLIQDRISKVADEADFLIKLIDEHLYSDVGQLTDKGMTVMGMHGQNYNVYMAQSARYADEILKLNKQIAEDPYNQDLIKRREELLDLQRDSILAAEGEKDAIKDMVEEGINLELESMKKLIDTYTEALDSQKDLYDYQKKTAKQTKEIASLQKQLAAYQGDDSEENRARVQKIQTQLAEAQEELQESQYDKMVDDQKTMLDEFYDEYSALLNSRLDDVDTLVQEMIVVLNDNAVAISDTLVAETQNVGYTITEEMRSIWDKNAVDTANALQFVTDGILDNTTTVNTTLNTINANIASMISILNARAKTDVKAAQTSTAAKSTQANAKPSASASSSSKSSTTSKASTSSSSSSGGKRTDAENYGVALAIWNGNYGWGNGLDRKKRLEAKGFNYATIQSIISKMDKDGYVHRGTWPGKYYGIKDLAPYHYNKFAIGAKRIYEDQLAWTQEYGKEYIISPTSGAVLTPLSKGDSVLNTNASKNLWNMANTPGDFIKDVLGVDYNAPNSSGGNGVYTQNFESVVFTMPNVKNYDEMLRQMQRDRNFERLIKAMSIDIMDGKSSLNKTKAIK